MEHDLVGVVLVVADEALGPVVADGVGEDGAVAKAGAGDVVCKRVWIGIEDVESGPLFD